MKKSILVCLLLILQLEAAKSINLKFKDRALVNAPNFFVKGTARNGVESLLGKPTFSDDFGRAWYQWSHVLVKLYQPNYKEVYSRFNYTKGNISEVEIVKINKESSIVRLIPPKKNKEESQK